MATPPSAPVTPPEPQLGAHPVPTAAREPFTPAEARARKMLLVMMFALFGGGVVALILVVTDIAAVWGYNEAIFALMTLPVAALNALVWRSLVRPIARATTGLRVLIIVITTVVLGVLSVVLVFILVLLLISSPIGQL